MTITKRYLIKSVNETLGLSKKRTSEIIDTIFEIIKSSLENGEDVLISGFGKFCVKDKKDRRGRKPKTGEDLILASRRVVNFRCSKVLSNKINGKKIN